MVGIKAHSNEHGWEIFVTMNDRGARLSPIDLLKGHLIEKAARDRTDLNTRWREMLTELSALDPRAPADFIETLLLAKYAKVDEPEDRTRVLQASHEWVRTNPDQMGLRTSDDYRRFLTVTVTQLAGRYRTLRAAATRSDPEFAHVRYNATNNLDQQYMLILAATNPNDQEGEFRRKTQLISSFLDLIYIRQLVNGTISRPGELDDYVYELTQELRSVDTSDSLADVLSRRLAEIPDEFQGMTNFGLQTDNRSQVRYLLARITAFVETDCEQQRTELEEFLRYVAGEKPFEIEHIWANKFERHQSEVKTESEFRSIRNRLGGLILLPKSDNASFNADTYPEKLPHYFRQNMLAKSLNKDSYKRFPSYNKFRKRHQLEKLMGHYDEFTASSIKERQQLYIRLCEIVWDPEKLGFSIPKSMSRQRRQARRTRANYDVSLGDLITAGFLRSDHKIIGRHKGTTHHAVVHNDGKVEVSTGELFPSPSRAAMYAVNRQSCNGWTFWKLADDASTTLADVRAQALASGKLDTARQLTIP
ncbi:GmrSD restriction endonuclease domain-containing protein [Prauserella rugosa]|uniref:Uncharacterized protein DUF1524 n=1 Tax=Prauserella rugosa TaxID=43354 RepID=A0A660CH51_9PSEU|nr:DUF1524 domain-containing protein [Prauserella rugosa]KMS92202.1 hypothetical protein ACZ91_05575 [Streptomyces regensis]TWH20361.1 uncharacterized protein DUF1524 [Prauserella rugosa]